MAKAVGFCCALGLVVACGAAQAQPQASWKTLAACAGAYRANAKVSDPTRPASMTAQVSEVAEEYEKAAAEAYLRATGVRPATAKGAVAAYAAKRGEAFGKQSRRRVEKFIEACPQVDAS